MNDWNEVSEESREWLRLLGDFSPTVKRTELKGHWGEQGKTYLDAVDLRGIAAACVEAADWLEKWTAIRERADAKG